MSAERTFLSGQTHSALRSPPSLPVAAFLVLRVRISPPVIPVFGGVCFAARVLGARISPSVIPEGQGPIRDPGALIADACDCTFWIPAHGRARSWPG